MRYWVVGDTTLLCCILYSKHIRWHWRAVCVDELLQSADDKLFEKIIHKVSAHVLQPLIPDRPPSSSDLAHMTNFCLTKLHIYMILNLPFACSIETAIDFCVCMNYVLIFSSLPSVIRSSFLSEVAFVRFFFKSGCLRYEWLASEVSLGSRESGCHCVSVGLRSDLINIVCRAKCQSNPAAHCLELIGSLSKHIACYTDDCFHTWWIFDSLTQVTSFLHQVNNEIKICSGYKTN